MKLKIDTSYPKLVIVQIDEKGEEISGMEEENEYDSQALLPLIVKILTSKGVALQDLTEIEINAGPGSYTGLRVGASVAQALGFALNIPVNGALNKTPSLRYT